MRLFHLIEPGIYGGLHRRLILSPSKRIDKFAQGASGDDPQGISLACAHFGHKRRVARRKATHTTGHAIPAMDWEALDFLALRRRSDEPQRFPHPAFSTFDFCSTTMPLSSSFAQLGNAEVITLARKIGHEAAARLGDRLYKEKLARIHWATPDEERACWSFPASVRPNGATARRSSDAAHSRR
jgi:hypothetical protein